MLGKLAPGDVVTVTRIDRLARSTFDLFAIVKRIVDANAQFRSLAEPWADTGTSTGRLMLAVLGGLADVERDLIRTRRYPERGHDAPHPEDAPASHDHLVWRLA
jgi:DNA invertase Pin-like site-specific DNA recombinase